MDALWLAWLWLKKAKSVATMSQEQDQQNPGSEDEGAQNPFDEFARAEESDPIIKASMNYLRGEFNISK